MTAEKARCARVTARRPAFAPGAISTHHVLKVRVDFSRARALLFLCPLRAFSHYMIRR